MKPRYFPPYSTIELPARERADFGPKGDHTWQSYGPGGGGGGKSGDSSGGYDGGKGIVIIRRLT